jgi:hypothetical protein
MARDFLLNFGTATKALGAGAITTLPNVVDVGPNGINGANGVYVRVVVLTTGVNAGGTGTANYSCSLEASKEPTATISTGTWSPIALTPTDVVANRTTAVSGVVTEGAVVMFMRIHAPAGTMATATYTVGGVTGQYAEDNYTKFRVKVTDTVTGITQAAATYSASIVTAQDGSLF